MNQDAEIVKDGLTIWLGMLRDSFGRLYFISNEEMIDIFGKSEELINKLIDGKQQAFLHNLFEGIDTLQVSSESRRIQGLYSKVGEYVAFPATISTASTPEKWLQGLEQAMILALKGILFESYELMDRDCLRIPEPGTPEFRRFMNDDDRLKRKIKEPIYLEWVTKFPGQSTYLSSQISFKQKIEAIFLGA